MKFHDWSPEKDKYLKPMEVQIHEVYHQQKAEETITEDSIFKPKRFRIKSLKKGLKTINQTLKGNILEVGAGDGWCSAYILKNYPQVEQVYTMEINQAAVEKLIPKVFTALEVDTNKANIVKGSFNDIPLTNHFDYVIAMGAIHHSSNLFQTLRTIYKSLKPGGWLLAQEPFMPSETDNEVYKKREQATTNFKGIQDVKNSDRTDIFYRACEYQTAAYHAGFQYKQLNLGNQNLSLLTKLKYVVKPPKNRPTNMVLLAQKPTKGYDEIPPNAWEYN